MVNKNAIFTIGSLFDGSGGFPLAAAMCGGTPSWASEVEPYPIAVTRSRLPAMKHLGDITKINGADIAPVNAVTFGSPCQGLSNAGLQKGLEDHRSILFFEAVRVIKEMREATNGVYPRFAVWENVPGAFSSNGGEDFRIVLETLIKIVEPSAVMPPVPKGGWPYADSYCGDGWSLAYRVFDAQHWGKSVRDRDSGSVRYLGTPQRRRRIYLVLDLGGECARKILFERKGLQGYFEAGRTPWKGIEANAQNCVRADDQAGETGCIAFHLLQDPVPNSKVSPCMGQGNSDGGQASIGVAYSTSYVGSFLPQKKAESIGWSTEDISGTLHNGACAGFQNGIVLRTVDMHILDDQGGSQISVRDDGKCPTLRAEMHGNVPAVLEPIGFDMYNQQVTGNVSRTLETPVGGDDLPVIFEPICCIDGDKIGKAERAGGSGLGIREGDKMYTLTAKDAGTHAVAYSFDSLASNSMKSSNPHSGCREVDVAKTFDTSDQNPSKNQGGIAIVQFVAGVDCWNMNETPELFPTLQAKPNGGQSLNFSHAVRIRYIVRRLIPAECARLQGFADRWGVPDHKKDFTDEEYRFWLDVRKTHAAINGKAVKDYTKSQMLKWYNNLHTDSSEYKMWGNGIALPCALYVMQGIADVFYQQERRS